MTATPETKETRLATTLGVLTAARLILNGAQRFPYVILTPMAVALAVPRSNVETALSLIWITGAISPFTGVITDRVGRKRMMLIGLGLMAIFGTIAAIGQSAMLVLLAIVAGGIAKILYDPAMQAYIGDRTPYARRGMAIGITELSWAGALFIFGPLAAFLIVNASLGAIYGVLAASSIVAIILLAKILPGDRPDHAAHAARPSVLAMYRILITHPSALAQLGTRVLMSMSIQLIVIVYEAWLREAFALTTIALGTLALVFSVAEVSGEGVVIAFADRFGKRRLAIMSIVATALSYGAVPFAGSTAAAAACLFLMFLFFEISVVVLVPMATEVLPQARGTMMSATVTSFSAGNALGILIGGWLFRTTGMISNGVLALILGLMAAGLIWRYCVEHPGEEPVATLIEH